MKTTLSFLFVVLFFTFSLPRYYSSSSPPLSPPVDDLSLSPYDTALSLASQSDFSSSIPHFLDALALLPRHSPLYNDYGVVLLRTHSLLLSRLYFSISLWLDNENDDARDNLSRVERILKKKGMMGEENITDEEIIKEIEKHENKGKKIEKSKESNNNKKKTPKNKKQSNESPINLFDLPPPPPRTSLLPPYIPSTTGLPHPSTSLLRRPNKNTRRPLPTFTLSNFYHSDNHLYVDGKLPYKIRLSNEEYNEWKPHHKWTPQYFLSHYPSSLVDFYPHNMGKSTVHPFMVPFSTALKEMNSPSSAYPNDQNFPGTYIQWNIHHAEWGKLQQDMSALPWYFTRDEHWLSSCLSTDAIRDEYTRKVHWRMLLIGSKGAGMFNHQDVLRTASWQYQLHGKKRWHICPPSQSQYLYSAGSVNTFDPDYVAYPKYSQATECYEDIVNEGEYIYYPKDYWHQTENLVTPTISLSVSILDENNHGDIERELKGECDNQKYKWGFSKELCEELLGKCKEWWGERYDMGKDNEKRGGQCTIGDKQMELRMEMEKTPIRMEGKDEL